MPSTEYWKNYLNRFCAIDNIDLTDYHTFIMAKVCDLSGKKVQFGNNVSKANNKTRRKFNPNMQSTTFRSALLNKNVRFNVAASSIRTVTKFGGIDEFLIRTKSKNLSTRAKRIRKTIQRIAGKAS